MQTHPFYMRLFLLTAGMSLSATFLQAAVLQVGTGGGMTSPGLWTSGGVVTNAFIAMTVDADLFGTLYDSGNGTVGGGTVSGDLYYAFTARSLDRMGSTVYCPTNTSTAVPYTLGTSFAGGQLLGAGPVSKHRRRLRTLGLQLQHRHQRGWERQRVFNASRSITGPRRTF